VGGWLLFYISPKLSEVDKKVLKRTIQETSHDGPDGNNRAVKLGSRVKWWVCVCVDVH